MQICIHKLSCALGDDTPMDRQCTNTLHAYVIQRCTEENGDFAHCNSGRVRTTHSAYFCTPPRSNHIKIELMTTKKQEKQVTRVNESSKQLTTESQEIWPTKNLAIVVSNGNKLCVCIVWLNFLLFLQHYS